MSKCDNCIHVGVCHYIMFGDSDEITECRHYDEERPKGEWKSTKQGGIPITDRCTNCNYKMKWYTNKHKFCPECGAEMVGSDKE